MGVGVCGLGFRALKWDGLFFAPKLTGVHLDHGYQLEDSQVIRAQAELADLA